MAFRAELDKFPVGEVLQMLAHGKRTGVANLVRHDDSVRLVFLRGQVVFATSDSHRRLGDALVQHGHIMRDVLEEFLRTHTADDRGLPLASLLVEAELVPKEVVEEETRRHIRRVVRRALEWDHGQLAFGSCELDKKLLVLQDGVSVESLLLAHTRDEKEPQTEPLATSVEAELLSFLP